MEASLDPIVAPLLARIAYLERALLEERHGQQGAGGLAGGVLGLAKRAQRGIEASVSFIIGEPSGPDPVETGSEETPRDDTWLDVLDAATRSLEVLRAENVRMQEKYEAKLATLRLESKRRASELEEELADAARMNQRGLADASLRHEGRLRAVEAAHAAELLRLRLERSAEAGRLGASLAEMRAEIARLEDERERLALRAARFEAEAAEATRRLERARAGAGDPNPPNRPRDDDVPTPARPSCPGAPRTARPAQEIAGPGGADAIAAYRPRDAAARAALALRDEGSPFQLKVLARARRRALGFDGPLPPASAGGVDCTWSEPVTPCCADEGGGTAWPHARERA